LVGDLPQEDTTKAGQRQKRAVENLGFPYEVATYCNLLSKDGDLKKNSPHGAATWAHCFSQRKKLVYLLVHKVFLGQSCHITRRKNSEIAIFYKIGRTSPLFMGRLLYFIR